MDPRQTVSTQQTWASCGQTGLEMSVKLGFGEKLLDQKLGVVCESAKGILDVKLPCLLEPFSAHPLLEKTWR